MGGVKIAVSFRFKIGLIAVIVCASADAPEIQLLFYPCIKLALPWHAHLRRYVGCFGVLLRHCLGYAEEGRWHEIFWKFLCIFGTCMCLRVPVSVWCMTTRASLNLASSTSASRKNAVSRCTGLFGAVVPGCAQLGSRKRV